MLYYKLKVIIKNLIKPKNKSKWAGDILIALIARLVDDMPDSIQCVVVSPFHFMFYDEAAEIVICNIQISKDCLSVKIEQNKLYPIFMLKVQILQALISTIYKSNVTVIPEDLYFNPIFPILMRGENAIGLHEEIINNKPKANRNNLKLVKSGDDTND